MLLALGSTCTGRASPALPCPEGFTLRGGSLRLRLALSQQAFAFVPDDAQHMLMAEVPYAMAAAIPMQRRVPHTCLSNLGRLVHIQQQLQQAQTLNP